MYGQAVIQSIRFPKEENVHFFINNVVSTLGQSFSATKTGLVYSISITLDKIFSSQNFNKQVNLWLEANPDPGEILEGAPHQMVATQTGEVVKFTLDRPFPVVKGKVYRMQFGYTSEENTLSYLFKGSLRNPYPNGNIYFHNGMPQMTRDLDFSVIIN